MLGWYQIKRTLSRAHGRLPGNAAEIKGPKHWIFVREYVGLYFTESYHAFQRYLINLVRQSAVQDEDI